MSPATSTPPTLTENEKPLIEAFHLAKSYGHFQAVMPLTLQVKRGDIVGFLGPNGAGKSTTLRMLSGALTPSNGSVLINGFPIKSHPNQAKALMGYLPENAPLYQEMTPESLLLFIASCQHLTGSHKRRRVDTMIGKLFLEQVAKQPISTLSKGYRRRVALACALIHNPPVLILDEPTDGLDPKQKHQVYSLLKEMADYKAIILSTHRLDDVEAVCNRALVISEGQLIADTTPDKLKQKASDYHTISVKIPDTDTEHAKKAFEKLSTVSHIEWLKQNPNEVFARLKGENPLQLLIHVGLMARQQNWTFDELTLSPGSLEQVFRELT